MIGNDDVSAGHGKRQLRHVRQFYFFEKYLRYTFSPYIQLAIALGGILSKNWSSQSPAAIYALCLIIIGPGVMFISKIISTIYKSIT